MAAPLGPSAALRSATPTLKTHERVQLFVRAAEWAASLFSWIATYFNGFSPFIFAISSPLTEEIDSIIAEALGGSSFRTGDEKHKKGCDDEEGARAFSC